MTDLENITRIAKKIASDYQSKNFYSIIDTYMHFLLPVLNKNQSLYNQNVVDTVNNIRINVNEQEIYKLCCLLLNSEVTSSEYELEYLETLNSSIPQMVFNSIISSDMNSDSNDALLEIRPDFDSETSLSNKEIERLKLNMLENLKSLDDDTVDVMDILWSYWIKRAESANDSVIIHVDDILALKNYTPIPTKSTHTYKKKHRDEIIKHIETLKNTWIIIKEAKYIDVTTKTPKEVILTGESPLIVIGQRYKKTIYGKDSVTMYAIRPGDLLSEYMLKAGRPLLALSKKALSYDDFSQRDEKRLTRIISWGWNTNNSSQTFKIKYLLELIKKEHSVTRFQRIKDDVEDALNVLCGDNVISTYKYSKMPTNPDYEDWLSLSIIVYAPDWLQKYNSLKQSRSDSSIKAKLELEPKITLSSQNNLGLALKKKRLSLNLTVRDTSKILGISASTITRIENNTSSVIKKNNKDIILKWLEDGN